VPSRSNGFTRMCFAFFWWRTKYSYHNVSLHEQTFEFPVAGPCLSIQIIAWSFQLSHNWTTDCFLPRWFRTWPGITLLNKMLNRVSLCCSTAVGWTAVRPQEMHTEMVQQEGEHYMRNLQPGRYFCLFCYKVTSAALQNTTLNYEQSSIRPTALHKKIKCCWLLPYIL
jgi:hypothetical protein